MSYDLFFSLRKGELQAEQFEEYFYKRPHYKLNGSQAWYENEDTGVYFSFEFKQTDDSEEEDQPGFPVSLNINYFRPSYFILEAEPEVTEFVKAFDLTVFDPQTDGMGEGEYSKDLLISGWNHGNQWGTAAYLQSPDRPKEILTLPSAILQRVWKWNRERESLQNRIGGDQYAAIIAFHQTNDRAATFVVWPDAIPIVVPPVDHILIVRDELAPRRFLIKRKDTALVSWEQVNQVIHFEKFPKIGIGTSLMYDTPPFELLSFVKSLSADSVPFSSLPADQVLDQELVEKIRK
jgi:hypothetical protein